MAIEQGPGGGRVKAAVPSLRNEGNNSLYGSRGSTATRKKVVAKKPVNHVPAIKRLQAPKPPPRPVYAAKPAYSSGKTVGSGKTGRIAPVAPPKPVVKKPVVKAKKPVIPGFEDTTYMQQTNDAKKAMSDYIAQMNGQQGNYDIEYTRNLGNIGDQSVVDETNVSDDYASRGMGQSGLYLKGMTDQKDKVIKQKSALAGGKAEYSSNLSSALQNFTSEQNINNNRYKQDAINRRALKYNLA